MNPDNKKSVFQGKYYRITVLSERLVRLEYNVEGKFNDNLSLLVKNRDFPMPSINVQQDEKFLVITTKYFTLQYTKEKPFLGPKYAPDTNLKIALLRTDKTWYYGHPEARNFKADAFSLDNYTGDVKLFKGLYSTDGFATLDDTGNYQIDANGFLVKDDSKRVDLYVFMYKRDFGLCLKDYFTLTGYPPLVPRYSLGIWWNKEKIYRDQDLENMANQFSRYQVPLAIMLLSEFWHLKDASNYNLYKTGFTFNPELFAHPEDFIKNLQAKKIHLGLNIDPTEGIRPQESSYAAFAQELGIQNNETIPFNIFNPHFVKVYLQNVITPLINLGVDVFWLDYKKDLEALQGLNYYQKENFKAFPNKRPLVLTRNPLVAPHNYPVLYSGETIVSWDTLKYLPFFNSLAANKGISWWSHDVGGFKGGIEDGELYLRYVQFATFSPIFRLSAKRGPYYKREPWLWDVKTFTVAREYFWLRHRLIPYIYTEAYHYHKNGIPLIQPLYYSYPEVYDEPLYNNEYYFGKEFLVSPITKPMNPLINRSIHRLFLPSGTWYDFKTGKKFIGNKRYVAFYNEEDYPVFVKSGTIIPLANLGENKNDTGIPDDLELNVFPGNNNIYKLYEDDGETNDYQNGEYCITAIDYNYLKNNYTLIIHPLEGNPAILPPVRNYKIRFRNTRHADDVTIYVNQEKITDFKAWEDANDFVIAIDGIDTTKQLTINCKGQDIEIDATRIINEDINSIINDLKIATDLKEQIAGIIFSDLEIHRKRIALKKIKKLDKRLVKMFLKLLEYIAEI